MATHIITFATAMEQKTIELDFVSFEQAVELIAQAVDKRAEWLTLNFIDAGKTVRIHMPHIIYIEYS